jgi:hypothetical protein
MSFYPYRSEIIQEADSMSRSSALMLLIPAIVLALVLALHSVPADAAPSMGITPTPTYTPTEPPRITPTPKPYEIPEPSTLALLGGGLATLLGVVQLRVRRR